MPSGEKSKYEARSRDRGRDDRDEKHRDRDRRDERDRHRHRDRDSRRRDDDDRRSRRRSRSRSRSRSPDDRRRSSRSRSRSPRDHRSHSKERDSERHRDREHRRDDRNRRGDDERVRDAELEKEKDKSAEKDKEAGKEAALMKETAEEMKKEQAKFDEEFEKRRKRLEAWRAERAAKEAASGATSGAAPASDATPSNAAAASGQAAKEAGGEPGVAQNEAMSERQYGWSLDNDDEEEEEASPLPKPSSQLQQSAHSPTHSLTSSTQSISKQLHAIPASAPINAPPAPEPEIDPLDAFMLGIQSDVKEIEKKEKSRMPAAQREKEKVAGSSGPLRERFYADDEVARQAEEEEDDSDEDVASKLAKKKKQLEAVDHSKVTYDNFKKDFYIEVPEITRMTDEEVATYRKEKLGDVKLRGRGVIPKPIKEFTQCGLSNAILAVNKKLNYQHPTPIQAQAIPAIMSGRNVIGIAKTGSGKTLAYLLPMLRHIMAQPPVQQGEGPIGLIMAPTRELALQIHGDAKKYTKATAVRSTCIYGGGFVQQQIGELKRGVEIVVCTPGRMIDVLTANNGKVTNLKRVTFLVLDEADRMFDMGFEPQIMRIIENVRPTRQTVMFSATFPKQVEMLAKRILHMPLEIVVGSRSVVADTVTQVIEVRPEETKFRRLLELVKVWYSRGNILVFVDRQDAADQLFKQLTTAGYVCRPLHGGMDQLDRDATLADFKLHNINMLIATSVAARGLDVKDLNLVINFNVPTHLEDYVHRVGRTGRAGNKGTAYTFIAPEEENCAPHIVKALQDSGTQVPEELTKLFDSFNKKKESGQLVQAAGSGFTGKGYKFDEGDQKKLKEQRKKEKLALGLDVEYESENEEDDLMDSEEEVAAAKKKEEDANMEEKEPDVAELQKEFLSGGKPPKAEEEKANPLVSAPVAEQAILQLQAAAAKVAQTPNAQDALAQARAVVQQVIQSQSKMTTTVGKKDSFAAELEINDYPQQARWKVTHKDALNTICEFTGCAVTTKGTFYPTGRAPVGDRKLYLLIEGPTEIAVKRAKQDIRKILDEATALSIERPEPARTGKYSVV